MRGIERFTARQQRCVAHGHRALQVRPGSAVDAVKYQQILFHKSPLYR
jgi:hypothetical protein